MPFVTVGGLGLHYQRMGRGEDTVVFIHGLVMDNLSSWWYTVANAAARNAESIVYDLRGHGLSERPTDGYTVSDAVADLAGLLDALDVSRPVHLVGNSFGAVVGLAFAVAHPTRVASVVVVEGHASIEGQGAYDRDKVASGLELAGWFLEEDEVNAWLDGLGGRKLNRMARSAKELLFECTLVEDLRTSPPFTRAELRSIECPVLALYGENSDILGRAKQLAAVLANCELVVLPGCTHSVLIEAVGEIRRRVIEWVAAHPAAAGTSAGR